MFEGLQRKWKVGGIQLLLILCTFALGGSLTGFAGRKLMNLLPIDKGVAWIVLYIVFITLLWPLAVLLVSFPFGQFRFFRNYLRKMGARMGIINFKSTDKQATPPTVNLAIFASGAGSNAERIIAHFKEDPRVNIALIVCNKPGAGVLDIARRENIQTLLIDRDRFFRGDAFLPELKALNIDFLVLAGFLWKVPDALIAEYAGRIINIHPALLPAHGGKGMYGNHVHAAVIAAGEKKSGITIHFVDGHYDNGDIIFQASCPVLPDDTPETLAARIHELEHKHFPAEIQKVLHNLFEL